MPHIEMLLRISGIFRFEPVNCFQARSCSGSSFGLHCTHSKSWCRFCVLPSAVYNSLGAGVPPTVQAAGRLRKGRSGLGFRVGSLEEYVLLSVCEAQSRYS